jgi:hypothetical protein
MCVCVPTLTHSTIDYVLSPGSLIRSFIPLSPILNLRALSRRKDSSLLRINSRIQVFYDEQGFVCPPPPQTTNTVHQGPHLLFAACGMCAVGVLRADGG